MAVFEIDGSLNNDLMLESLTLKINGSVGGYGSTISDGDMVEIFAANHNKFTSVLYSDDYMSGMGDVDFDIDPDGKRAYTTWNDPYTQGSGYRLEWTTIDDDGTGDPDPEPEPEPDNDYIITSDFVDLCRVNGITIAVDGVVKGLGDTIPAGSSLTLTLNTGGFHYVSWGFDPFTGMMNDFVISSDKSVATMSPFLDYLDGEPSISAYGVTPTEPPVDVALSLLYSYSLKETDLPKLADARAAIFNDGAGGDVDFTKYFLGLYRLPFTIPTDAIENERQITIGFFKSSIVANYFIKDTLIYDMGTVSIPMVKNNFLDFKNTVCVLHLPYSEPVNIDNEYLIGESISIVYEINVVTGDAVINVISDKIGSSIYTRQINLGLEIPFAPKQDSERIVLNNQIGLGNNNGVLVPFVEVLRNDALLENGVFTVPVIDESILSLQSGYVEIEKINLLTRATDSEIIGLNMLLNDGVYIND